MNRNQNGSGQSGTPENALFAGIEVQNLTQQLRTEANVPANVNGVIVTSVDPGSPVAQQVRPGDVIEQINRQSVSDVDEFQRVVGQLDSDRPVMVGLARNRQRSFVIIQPN
jgi:serine protease Do